MGALKDKINDEQTTIETVADIAENTEQVGETSTELAEIHEPKLAPAVNTSIWTNPEQFATVQRAAQMFALSGIAPESYRGAEKEKLANCVIAIDVANRMGVSPLVVMQNSQIVHGNFSWKGTACKAMIDGCGKYTSTRYVEVGNRADDTWGYYLEAIDKQGKTIKGVTVDIAMAKADGWYGRNLKWKSMPELMLKYRAAAFFMRTECSGLAMGFLTTEEQEDIGK